ncbi:hypothetical protein BFO_1026 [Tannerella forsythia 92A2]|uniref:Uncharacterized protein n=1 Tax=Tannerella forsythia (strain ATCC 43037 / JCM 10827 / CCUG 21028 A / KCTC 5666 / FDC 338) TaxID=203275 RepID=G8UQM8_TANFA|nr:hypothetical protein BFO_1026 [Tannerella forsythia 92A2]
MTTSDLNSFASSLAGKQVLLLKFITPAFDKDHKLLPPANAA